jgi:alanyl aminopeptidase
VVETTLPALRYVHVRGLLGDESLAKYQAFIGEAFGKRARSLGWTEKKGEPDDTRILRPHLLEIVGDEGGDGTMRAEARKVAFRWLADHKSTSPELASAALYLSAIGGDAALFDKLHEAAKKETDRVERQRILDALGSFRDPELAQKAFAIYLTDEFDPREAFELIAAASDDPRTREAALAFVEKNFDAVVARLPYDSAAGMPGLGSGFCDDEHASALGQFFRPLARKYPGMDRRLAQAMESVRQCAAFREKEVPGLVQYLKSR